MEKAPSGLSIRLIYSPQAFIGPKGAIPSFHFSNIPSFHYSNLPFFHHSIIPGWKKKNGWREIPYHQRFVEIPIHPFSRRSFKECSKNIKKLNISQLVLKNAHLL
jgi:hypothetical protein